MDRRETWFAVMVGALVGTALGLGGFFLTRFEPTNGMGVTMFVVTPFAAGFASGLVVKKSRLVIVAASLLALLVSLLLLVSLGKEGMLCAILAFPLLFLSIVAGAAVALLLRHILHRNAKTETTFTAAVLLLTPAMLAISHHLERPRLDRPRIQTITNEVRVSAPVDVAWKSIQSIDEVTASKPFLMYIGLPIPMRCTLDRPGLGAKRICYFNNGSIEETVTEWTPPKRMALRIDRTNMPGRHWLGFEDAAYDLIPENNGTVVRRTTAISSHLYPAWYWAPFERMGVEAEHQYILDDLSRRFSR
jgi:Polyketide cyclase / dehydrase and lipid transport